MKRLLVKDDPPFSPVRLYPIMTGHEARKTPDLLEGSLVWDGFLAVAEAMRVTQRFSTTVLHRHGSHALTSTLSIPRLVTRMTVNWWRESDGGLLVNVGEALFVKAQVSCTRAQPVICHESRCPTSTGRTLRDIFTS